MIRLGVIILLSIYKFMLKILVISCMSFMSLIYFDELNKLNISEGTYVINDNYYIYRTSTYHLILNGKHYIPAFIDSIGWDDEYIVALQYDLEYGVADEPNWSKPNYYIIQLEDDTLIGPLSPEEYENSEYSYLELKKINT